MSPTFSIIIPVYNQERFIRQCLDSIVTQTVEEFELIIVDDGSTDQSASICDEYARKDSRIIVIHKENEGVSIARNKGLDIAKGKWVSFVDADDTLLPGALARMTDGMKKPLIDLYIGGYIINDDNGNVIYSVPESNAEHITRNQGIEQMYVPHPYRYQGYIWNKMFRRSIIEQNRIRFDESIYFNEDRLFVTQYISAQTGMIFFDSVPVYSYYERTGGAMTSLRNHFNPKFVTDFDAMIKMYKVIHRTFNSKKLNMLALEGVMNSYSIIHNMMESFGGVEKTIHKTMQKKLVFSLPLGFLIKKKLRK